MGKGTGWLQSLQAGQNFIQVLFSKGVMHVHQIYA